MQFRLSAERLFIFLVKQKDHYSNVQQWSKFYHKHSFLTKMSKNCYLIHKYFSMIDQLKNDTCVAVVFFKILFQIIFANIMKNVVTVKIVSPCFSHL